MLEFGIVGWVWASLVVGVMVWREVWVYGEKVKCDEWRNEADLLLEKAESKLNSAKIGERNIRDAISRAYYCMHTAKAILCLKEKYPRTHRGCHNLDWNS